MNLDLYFFNLIHGLSGRKKWLDFWGIFCAKYLGYVLAVILCAAAFMAKNAVIFIMPILSGCFSRFVINELIYFFYKRKRPAQTMPIKSLVKIPRYPAFPSGHASFFFALSFALLPFNFNLAVIFIIASFLISFGRIFVGVHWPADILGGIIAGGFSAILMKLDLHFFNLINGLAGSWSWPDYLGIFLAKYFEYFLWFCLILFLAVNFKKHWKMVLQAFVAGI